MGIPGFSTWFLKKFGFACSVGGVRAVDHLYIDLNAYIHNLINSKNEEAFILRLFAILDNIFKIAQPKKSLFLVLDGSAPLAKLLQQRKRRITRKAKHKVFDSNQITPGTIFMNKLNKALKYYVCQRLSAMKYRYVDFYLSGSDVPGEGELKIVNYLLKFQGQERNDTFLIVGSDADLILQSLNIPLPNLTLLKPHPPHHLQFKG
uniref:Xrn1 N-terminal domain-containing protein n=1 Tax=Arcella intermedia TaxID=1963864 RepID=A0A6B2LIK1_9EUKA